MQIRTLFIVCMAVVAALGACLGGWMLTQMVLQYQLAGRVERVVEIDTLLFDASDKIAAERPATGNALLLSTAVDAPTRATLSTLREAADRALGRVEAHIASLSYPGAAGQLAIVRKTSAELAAWRSKVDLQLNQPKSRRDADIFSRYLHGVNAVFEATDTALDLGDIAAALHDGLSVELIALSRNIWMVRSTMGLRTVPLMAAIDTGAMLDPAGFEAQARYDGILDATWVPIAALARRLSDVPGLAASIEAGSSAFKTYNDICHEVLAANRNRASYPISALDLGRRATGTAPLLLKIRDDALAAAGARVAHSRQMAAVYVVVAACVLALTMVAVAGVLLVLQRRIILPMLALTEVIGRIARMDFDVPIPARDRADEIGRMALALDDLRTGAMAGEKNKARIDHLANHDPLTDLANRAALEVHMDDIVAMSDRGQMSALLCVDLDRFKAVNDSFGHPMGDLLLKSVAERLLACVREVDTVSRLGGDEFVILLAGLEQSDQAAVVAQRIVHTLGRPFNLKGQVVSVGCSVGIAITPQDARSAIALMRCADTALYRAKAEGKGTWRFFEPEMDLHLQERMALEGELRDAVSNQAFELAYQPLYTLASKSVAADRLCGFEALLRWRHPERGSIGAGTFLAIAEETGLIVPIGEWVLRQACAEAMNWPNDLKVAVNLSAVQFKNLDLVETLRRALADSGLPARRLEVEITETVLLTNSDINLAMLQEMHAIGIHLAMDDFGTGYSSLSYLRRFPFDTIKIDQSFVRDVPDDEGACDVVRSAVALANSLGMTTTAEGVETSQQLEELRRQGCTNVQGYFFSKPVQADQALLLAGAAVMEA